MAHSLEYERSDLPKINTIDAYSVDAKTIAMIATERKWLLGYIVYASILWISIASCIFFVNTQKAQLAKKKTWSCCKCWAIANQPNYNGPQIDWSHCLNDCSCNLCAKYTLYLTENDDNNTTLLLDNETCSNLNDTYLLMIESTFPTKEDQKSDEGCLSNLSTTGFFILEKNYNYYGYIGIIICSFQILLLWLYLALCKRNDIGIIIFINSFVSSEICYYVMIKSYQYQFNENTDCFENIMNNIQKEAWKWSIIIVLLQLGIQWFYVLSRCCCSKGRSLKKIYSYLGIIIAFISPIAILVTFILFTWISIIIFKHRKLINKNSTLIPLIFATICQLLAVFGILPFPFCRKMTNKYSGLRTKWTTYFCFKYCRNNKCCKLLCSCCLSNSWYYGSGRSYRSGLLKPYSEQFGLEADLLSQQTSDQSQTMYDDIDRHNSIYGL